VATLTSYTSEILKLSGALVVMVVVAAVVVAAAAAVAVVVAVAVAAAAVAVAVAVAVVVVVVYLCILIHGAVVLQFYRGTARLTVSWSFSLILDVRCSKN
jgi:hypothetical protein